MVKWLESESCPYIVDFFDQDQQSRELSQGHIKKRARALHMKVLCSFCCSILCRILAFVLHVKKNVTHQHKFCLQVYMYMYIHLGDRINAILNMAVLLK